MKNTKKIYISLAVLIVVILIGTFIFYRLDIQPAVAPTNSNEQTASSTEASASDHTYIFNCNDGKSITATFHLPQDKFVSLVLSDGRSMDLPHAISADGARYASQDESIVFWNKGDTAFIQENGTTTYENCITGGSVSENNSNITSSGAVSTYTNDQYGFELTYPGDLQPEYKFKQYYNLPKTWRVSAPEGDNGEAVVSIPVFRIDNQGANGSAEGKPYQLYFDAEVRVGVSSSTESVADCYKTDPGYTTQKVTDVEINGLTFKKFDFSGAGMMQYVQGESYRIIHNGTCYAVEAVKTGSSYRDDSMKPGIPDSTLDSYLIEANNIAQRFRFTK